jgi:hypothetical protein
VSPRRWIAAHLNQAVGAIIDLKLTHSAVIRVLISFFIVAIASFSPAQSAPPSQATDSYIQIADADQSTQQPAAGTGQTSGQTTDQTTPTAPAKPSPGQPAQPCDKNDQAQTSSQTPPASGQTPCPAKDSKEKDAKGTTASSSNDRLFFALPNFLTVDKNGKIIPLTGGQKFKIVARGAFDPVQIPWYGILSAIGQAEDSEPGYGQGWGSYGKRFVTYAADGTIENFFVGAIFPSMLHQDPRFFPKPEGSFVSRASYAVSRIVITRSDSGKREFNFSEVFGSAMASAISTYSYHPRRAFKGYNSMGDAVYYPSDRTLSNTASVWLSQMGYDAITITLKEFWPDIRRKVTKHPKPEPASTPAQ